jgi:4a-hydroxytetrahydrobiopterin dehydratase
MARVLTADEALSFAARVGEGWRVEEGAFVKSYTCANFRTALQFVNALGERAEEMNHHPAIRIDHSVVTIWLRTFSQDALTELDTAFVERAERIYRSLPGEERHL